VKNEDGHENGFDAQGNARTIDQAVQELSDAALRHYPDSEFAKPNSVNNWLVDTTLQDGIVF
jgi:hypothetical protein